MADKANDKSPEAAEVARNAVPDGHLRLKVRAKGHNKISTGETELDARGCPRDKCYAAGDSFVAPTSSANALLKLDYADLAD
jgi:hypothetical protein